MRWQTNDNPLCSANRLPDLTVRGARPGLQGGDGMPGSRRPSIGPIALRPASPAICRLPVEIPLRSTLGEPAEEDTYMPHSYRKMESPVGTLTLVARDDAFLVAILWQHERPNRVPLDEMRLSEDSSSWRKPNASCGNIFPANVPGSNSRSTSKVPNFRKRSGPPCSPFHSARPAAIRK